MEGSGIIIITGSTGGAGGMESSCGCWSNSGGMDSSSFSAEGKLPILMANAKFNSASSSSSSTSPYGSPNNPSSPSSSISTLLLLLLLLMLNAFDIILDKSSGLIILLL